MEGIVSFEAGFAGIIQEVDMRIKDGFVLRTICGEHVVVGEGLAQVNFNKMLSLNGSAAWLWEQVAGREFTTEGLAGLLAGRYDVTPEVALADAEKLAAGWKELGILE